ncbi:MAG: methyltransferase domain-containing protein [Acidimicrobiales bacterium]
MSWDPGRYERFEAERRQPFDDLVVLCTPVPGGTAVDLGCGTGRLTAELHRAVGAARTTGVDSSAAMLARAPRDVPGLAFAEGDLAAWDGPPADLVLANASFQWVDHHPALLARLRRQLRPGGQLAFQVPANFDHPSHRLAREVARQLGHRPPPDRGGAVLAPERYAELLDGLGAVEQHVRLQVYGHQLASTTEVVAWVSGTLLTAYREAMDPGDYDAFVDRYRQRLLEALGDHRPYFYAFPRILCRARFP